MLSPVEESARLIIFNAVYEGNELELRSMILRLGERAAAVVNTPNRYGDTALIMAVAYRDTFIARALLSIPGLDVNAIDQNGNTALICAAAHGCFGIVRALLAFPGINLTAENKEHLSAVAMAERHGYLEIRNLITSAIYARLAPQEENVRDRLINAARTNNLSAVTSIISHLGDRAAAVVNAADPSGDTALIWAARNRHITVVRALITFRGIDVNAANQSGDTALIWAAINGDIATTQLLLSDVGIDVNAADQFGNTALMLAAKFGRVAVVRVLLAIHSINLDAVNSDHLTAAAMAQRHISHSHDVFQTIYNLIMAASSLRPTQRVSATVSHADREAHNFIVAEIEATRAQNTAAAAPAAVAVANTQQVFRADSPAVVSTSVKLTRQQKEARSRLFIAVHAGDVSCVMTIMVELEERAAVVNSPDVNGNTVLISAVKNGHADVVRVLLAYTNGIDVNAVNRHGDTALILAFKLNYIDICKNLLDEPGINVNVADSDGLTVLMYAILHNNFEVIPRLLEFPDINLEAEDNDHHMTAAAMAEQCGQDCLEIHNLITSALHARRAPRVVAPVVAAPSFAERLAAIPDFNEKLIPERFVDPISREIMTDPIVCKSGHTYERSSLASYFKSKGNPVMIHCPATRFYIDRDDLDNNTCVVMRDWIEEFVLQQEAQYKQRQEQEITLAAAASNVNVTDENKSSDEAMPDTEKLRTTRLKMFGNTLLASHPASSLPAQPAAQDNEVVVDRRL